MNRRIIDILIAFSVAFPGILLYILLCFIMPQNEAQLNVCPHIIRCHRAFIVNLQHVSHATTSSAGLQLSFDATSLRVPVSRTYISIVKASLE